MENPDDDGGAAEAREEGQSGRGSPAAQGHLENQGGGGGHVDAGAPLGAVQGPRGGRPLPPLPPTAGTSGGHLHEYTLRVPFQSQIEAEMARRTLAPYEEHPSVHRELRVNGSVLIVTWVAENPQLIQLSFTDFAYHLSLLFLTMGRLGPLLPPVSMLGKGG